MTQPTVLRRDRVVLRNERGQMDRIVETEWNEPADVAKERDAALKAVAAQQERDIGVELRGARAERDRGLAVISQLSSRITELERELITTRAAHEAERHATVEAIAAATARGIERDEANAPKLIAALAGLVAPTLRTYTLPADLANLADLRALERELLEYEHAQDDEQAARDHVLWVLPPAAEVE